MEQLNYFTELSQATLPHALKGQKPLAQGVWSLYAKLELYLITSARMAGGIGSLISSCCNRRRSCP